MSLVPRGFCVCWELGTVLYGKWNVFFVVDSNFLAVFQATLDRSGGEKIRQKKSEYILKKKSEFKKKNHKSERSRWSFGVEGVLWQRLFPPLTKWLLGPVSDVLFWMFTPSFLQGSASILPEEDPELQRCTTSKISVKAWRWYTKTKKSTKKQGEEKMKNRSRIVLVFECGMLLIFVELKPFQKQRGTV